MFHLLQPVFFLQSASRPGLLEKWQLALMEILGYRAYPHHACHSDIWRNRGRALNRSSPPSYWTQPVLVRVYDVACSEVPQRSGPEAGARQIHCNPLAIFCNQVFFVYDPSSSTSLLSSVDITTKALTKTQYELGNPQYVCDRSCSGNISSYIEQLSKTASWLARNSKGNEKEKDIYGICWNGNPCDKVVIASLWTVSVRGVQNRITPSLISSTMISVYLRRAKSRNSPSLWIPNYSWSNSPILEIQWIINEGKFVTWLPDTLTLF